MSIHFTLLVLMKAKLINTSKSVVVNTNTLDDIHDKRKENHMGIRASFTVSGLSRC